MMKLYLAAVCAGFLAFCGSLQATPVVVGDPSDANFNAIVGGGNINTILLNWLQGEINDYNTAHSANLPLPSGNPVEWANLNGTGPTIPVKAGDYMILHYGAGPGGTKGSGGGLVALYFPTVEDYPVPNDGSGPNGFGGISFARVWDPPNRTPEGGTTVALLGFSLVGLRAFARFRK